MSFREGKTLGRWEVHGQQWLDFARAKREKFKRGARWAAAALAGIEIDDTQRLFIIRGETDTGEGTAAFAHELPYPSESREQAIRAMVALSLAYGLSPSDPES